MFELAARKKLRFNSPKGLLSVEDLWDLPLTSGTKANLDDIARYLHSELKDESISFVTPPSKAADGDTALAFEIVKHIIKVRLDENEAKRTATERSEKRQQLLALIAQKETEQLAGQPLEDLRKMAESL